MKNNSKKIIFHIDVNSAFLSWTAVELLKEDSSLDIRTIPSAICGNPENRHGIILAKSTPAKAFNIKTGETIQSALKKCTELKLYKPDYEKYKEYSKKLGEILLDFSPTIEQYSIDEYFMEYVPILGKYLDVAKKIQQTIFEKIGVTVNIGISTNKVLAKMAGDFEKPNKIHTLFKEEIKTKLWPLPIENLFLCGKSSSSKLRKIGINTIGKLALSDVSLLEYHLKSQGTVLHNYANGIDDSNVVFKEKNKCYSNSVTMPKDISTLEEANPILLALSQKVTNRMRKDNFKATTITLQVKLNTFQVFSHSKSVSIPTDITKEIYNISTILLRNNWNLTPVRLLGISLSNLVEKDDLQLDIFSINESIKQSSIDNSIDNILSKFGNNISIGRASTLKAKKILTEE